jgi:hypothetical protein
MMERAVATLPMAATIGLSIIAAGVAIGPALAQPTGSPQFNGMTGRYEMALPGATPQFNGMTGPRLPSPRRTNAVAARITLGRASIGFRPS